MGKLKQTVLAIRQAIFYVNGKHVRALIDTFDHLDDISSIQENQGNSLNDHVDITS